MGRITVIGPQDEAPTGRTAPLIFNTTSRSKDWGKAFSPFILGPVLLYPPFYALNVENGWQYAQCYSKHLDAGTKLPTQDYWRWAQAGWASPKARRYPMGKGMPPLFAWWNGLKLDYIQSRKQIFAPLYAQAVVTTAEFAHAKRLYADGNHLVLWDFDGYRHRDFGMNYRDVLNDPGRTMGHAFILAMLLEEQPAWLH
jgi:hypothetical protein